ncbi:MAG: DUF748 domain-containing protein [Nitrospirota bacterium]
MGKLPRLTEKVFTVQKILIILVSIFVVYSLAGFFALPAILRPLAEKNLKESLHRPVSIQRVTFNPYNLSLAVYGITISEPRGGQRFASVDEFLADVQLASVIKLGVVLRELKVVNPYLRVIRNEDLTYNFSDLTAGPEKKKKGKPLNFYVGNITITGGDIVFDDRPKKASHEMDKIALAVPFVSNFKYYTETYVRPSFSARLDGRRIGLRGETKPFEKTEQTKFNVKIDALDIPKYLEYIPKGYKFTIKSGTFSAEGVVSYVKATETTAPRLSYQGSLSLDGINIAQEDGSSVAALGHAEAYVDDAEVLADNYKIDKIVIDEPSVNLIREPDGTLNLLKLFPQQKEKTPPEPKEKEAKKVHAELRELALSGGKINLTDRTVPGGFNKFITASFHLSGLQYGGGTHTPALFKLAATTDAGESFGVEGNLTPEPLAVEGKLTAAGISIDRYKPYYASAILFTANGNVQASSGFKYSSGEGGNTTLSDGSVLVKDVKLAKKDGTFTKVRTLEVKGLSADLKQKKISVGKVESAGAVITVLRGKDGTFNLTTLTQKGPHKTAPPAAEKGPGQAWDVVVKTLALNGYRVDLTDKTTTPAVKMSWSGIRLSADNIGTARGTKTGFNISLTVGGSGKLSAKGNIVAEPFSTKVALLLKEAPIPPLTPYLQDKMRIDITSGTVSGKGTVAMSYTKKKGFGASYAGDFSIGDFNTVEKKDGSRFLGWNSLYFTDIHSGVNPWLMKVGQISLTDFYSRIAIYPDGTTNLQGVVVAQKQAPSGSKPAPPAEKSAPSAQKTAESSPFPARPEDRPVTVGAVTLQGGQVDFSDSHIQPPYKMTLAEIGGRVSGLSSDPTKTADLDLKTKINNFAPAEITGKLNPLAKPIYVNISMRLDNMDLPPTSPYSTQYIGYGIVSGQLSLNLKYLVVKDKLTATNNIKIDQFNLSDQLENPKAKAAKYPVKLAIAIMKDRSGLIDLDIPVSGDLKNPKFTLGGVIWTAVKHILDRIVTAPFALIGRLFGGGPELGYAEFDYGRTDLSPNDIKKFSTLSKALFERPKLKMDITGRIDPAHDPEGLRRVFFLRELKEQKFKDLSKKEQPSDVDNVEIKPDEYNKYLKKAYKAATFPKPKGFLGIEKGLPPPEMEKLMLTNIKITPDDLKQLSLQRAKKVRDYLMTTGKVTPDRLFIAQPQDITAKEEKGKKASRVDFSLR